MKAYIITASLFLLLLAPCAGEAQWVKTNYHGGASITCFVVSDTNLFVGTLNGGVYLSTDNGLNWNPIDSGFTDTSLFNYIIDSGKYYGINALAMSGTNLFAGTDVGGIFLSTNNGKYWKAVDSGLIDNYINALAVIDTNVFVGTVYHGVFLSTNNGVSWTAVGWVESGIIQAFDVSGTNIFARTPGGVFRSTDNGTNWVVVNNGLKGFNNTVAPYVNTLASSGTNLFAGIDYGEVFLSTDSGASWTEASNGLPSASVYTLAVVGSKVFAGTSVIDGGSVYRSIDSGRIWSWVSTGLRSNGIYALAANDSFLFAGTEDSAIWRCSVSYFDTLGQSAVAEPQSVASEIQSYPNPFSQSTTISFTSPESGVAEVTVVNLLGSEVARLFEGEMAAGQHSFMWSKPPGLPEGMYECIVRMNGSVEQVPMMLMRN